MEIHSRNEKDPKRQQENYDIKDHRKGKRPSSIIQNIRKLNTLMKAVMKKAVYELKDYKIIEKPINQIEKAIIHIEETTNKLNLECTSHINVTTSANTKEEDCIVLKLANLIIKLRSILDNIRKEINSMQLTPKQTCVIAKEISDMVEIFDEHFPKQIKENRNRNAASKNDINNYDQLDQIKLACAMY